MKRIVAMIRPFDKKQKVFVFDGTTQIDAKTYDSIDNLELGLLDLSELYETDEINLSGPKQYNKGLAKSIEKTQMQRYSEVKKTINII